MSFAKIWYLDNTYPGKPDTAQTIRQDVTHYRRIAIGGWIISEEMRMMPVSRSFHHHVLQVAKDVLPAVWIHGRFGWHSVPDVARFHVVQWLTVSYVRPVVSHEIYHGFPPLSKRFGVHRLRMLGRRSVSIEEGSARLGHAAISQLHHAR